MKFLMLLARRPTSLNKPNALYRAAVAQAATQVMDGRKLLKGRLYARIIWFHTEPTTQDVDNIVKPILDALKNIVFVDDSQIGECHVTRIDLSRPYQFSGEPDPEIFNRFSALQLAREKHILWVEIGEAGEQIVTFKYEPEDL